MTHADAITLIREAVPTDGGAWADLGAGSGTFTRALANLIGPSGSVLAVERDEDAIQSLHELAASPTAAAPVSVTVGDFSQPLGLHELAGILLANSLHFIPYSEQPVLLSQLAGYLSANGRIVIVEYDRERGNDWVPYPVSYRALVSLAQAAGLTAPVVSGRMRSTFGGELYCTWIARP